MIDCEARSSCYWTHRAYFNQYNVNVEQYGEILISQAFGGTKMGDAQPCFDVEASIDDARERLTSAGLSATAIDACLCGLTDKTLRIEVKSKRARTAVSTASVIHCSDKKVEGARGFLPATHFAVLLVDDQGCIEEAWLLRVTLVMDLRRMGTKSRYVPVSALRKAASAATSGLVDIRRLVNEVATVAIGIK